MTEVEFKDGEYQDPCEGDSGGPLMYENPQSDGSAKWVIIGEFAPRTFGTEKIPLEMAVAPRYKC